jgi:hypothetical protein
MSGDDGVLTLGGRESVTTAFGRPEITEYLKNGAKLEIAQQMAYHESARMTGLYDRRTDQVSLDENDFGSAERLKFVEVYNWKNGVCVAALSLENDEAK